MVRRFVSDLVGAYADGIRSVAGLPLLFAFLIGSEFIQHVAEVRVGFYASAGAAHALSNDPSRMVIGWIKMVSVYLGEFFVIRYLVARNGETSLAAVGTALVRYLPYAVYSLTLFALVFYAPHFLSERPANALRFVVSFSQLALEPLLMLWIVSSATTGNIHTPLDSARDTGLRYFWGLGLFFLGRIPINAVHQVLARVAIGHQGAVLWTIFVADAVSVGLIISVTPALYVRIVSFFDERSTLAPTLPLVEQTA